MGLPVFLVLISSIVLSPAYARDVVLERGIARDCYLATLLDATADNNARALAACNKAVSAYADDATTLAAALANRAEILIRMNRFADAVADSERGLSIASDLTAALINRGAGLVGLQRYAEAVAALDRAIAQGGGKMELAYYNRGLAKDHEGDAKGAYLDYSKSVELNPNFSAPREQLPRFQVIYKKIG